MITGLNKIKACNEKYNVGLLLFIFCFLFAPPIIPNTNFIFIVFAYAAIMILFKYRTKTKSILVARKMKRIKRIFKIIIIYFVVYLLSIIINVIMDGKGYIDNYIINWYAIFLAFPITITCSMYIIFRAEELKLNVDNIIKLFIWAGLLQAFISILTLLSPEVKKLTIEIMYNNTGEELLTRQWLISRRFYGFAHSMLDLFGFGTGIIAVLSIYYSIKVNLKYIFATPLLLIVPLLNSRSGLVIFGIGVITILLYLFIKSRVKRNQIIKYVIILLLGIAVIYICVFLFSPNTIEWIKSDFASFLDSGETTKKDATANVLFSEEFWTLPKANKILIGAGYNISAYSDFAVEGIPHSDVGYINELWKTGILGSSILYYFIIYMLKSSYKISKKVETKALFVFLALAIFVFLIKCTIFTYNPGTVIIYTITLMTIYNKCIERNCEDERK